MSAPNNTKKAKRPLWMKILVGVGRIYLLYAIFGFFVAPIIMKNVLQGSVVEALDRTIALEKAAFDPFTLSVELKGLLVDDDDALDRGEPHILGRGKHDRYLDWKWSCLVRSNGLKCFG